MIRIGLEYAYWKSVLASRKTPPVSITPYVPQQRQPPARVLSVNSAWKGIESILPELIERFDIGTKSCLEFGVEFGYSTAALSSFFDSVVGVDTFRGDRHSRNTWDFYNGTARRLADFDNIQLVRSKYQDWIKHDTNHYDLIHVDIIHTFADTFACGLWSANHSKCTLFHDTESFPTVKQAVREISRISGKRFYNFQECFGLGILV